MRIIVIGGSQRSGTTLVQTLVANSLPNAPVLPEAHIVCDLLRTFKQTKSEWAKTSRIYETVDDAARFFRTAVETHIGDIRSRHGNIENLVLKDPNFMGVLTELAEVLPEATRIVCVRDPRDIVASYVKIGQRQTLLQQRTRYTRRKIYDICKKINAAYQPLLGGTAPRDCFLVRYEEMAADAAAAMRRLGSETGLPLNPERTADLVWLEDEYRHQETWRTPLEGGPPTAESVGNYQSVLSRLERLQAELHCRSLIDRFGYRATSDVEPRKTTVFERAKNLFWRFRSIRSK